MAKHALNKSVLNKQKHLLQTYRRFLPALELKQQQLMAEKKKAEDAYARLQKRYQSILREVAENLPMLGCDDIDLKGMVTVKSVSLGEEYIVGIHVPVVKQVSIDVVDYGYLSKPHWVDACVANLKAVTLLSVELQVQKRRVDCLIEATRSATQRVNLFSKILIPETQQAIRKIGVFISDMDTAAVVRSKMTKQKSRQRSQG